MSPFVTLRLALAGTRTDGVRVLLTALGAAVATLGLLAVATVLSIQPRAQVAPYTNSLLAESGLRPGLSFALLLTTLPVLFFVAQCSRFGAPAHDRRLASYRMGGATPAQTALIAATETGIAATLGTLLGAASYFCGRIALDAPRADGLRPLPTDVLPSPSALVAILVGVPLLVIGLSQLLLRRVSMTPFGVVRRSRRAEPRPWPGVLIVAGIGGWPAFDGVERVLTALGVHLADNAFLLVALTCALLLALGLVLGTGWLSAVGGRLVHRYARGPVAVLAGRRLMADPWAGSRSLGVIVVAMLFGAGAAVVHSEFATQFRAEEAVERINAARSGHRYVPADRSFYDAAFDLIQLAVMVALAVAAASLLVVLAEQIVAQRRSLAMLVAAGTPRSVLARAQLLQTVVSMVPAALLAVVVGAVTVFSVFPTEADGGRYCDADGRCTPPVRLTVPFPWADLVVLAVGSILAVLVATAVGLVILRSSTDSAELRTD